MKLQIIPRFPSLVQGINGDSVTKANATYSIGPNYGSLSQLGSIPDQTNTIFRVFNTITLLYNTVSIAALATAIAPSLTIRERLFAPATYYVRSADGNDSNNGKTNTSSGAFRTLQGAVNVLSTTIDANQQSVVIQAVGGPFLETVTLLPIVGAGNNGAVVLRGDVAVPSNISIIAPTAAAAIFGIGYGNDWKVEGFKIINSNPFGICVHGHAGAWIRFGVMEFGQSGVCHILADQHGIVEMQGSYTISGTAPTYHALSNSGGYVLNAGTQVTHSGTVNYGSAFTYATGGSLQVWIGATFAGAATGARFIVDNGSNIQASNGNLNFFPGNAAGQNNGGTYDNIVTTSTSAPIITPIITGVSDGSNAGAGKVGEVLEFTAALGAVSLSSGVAANIASGSLTAGDWEITISAYFFAGATTTINSLAASLSSGSAVMDNSLGKFSSLSYNALVVNNNAYVVVHLSPIRLSIAAPTTYYAVASAAFGVSTLTVGGVLHARRLR